MRRCTTWVLVWLALALGAGRPAHALTDPIPPGMEIRLESVAQIPAPSWGPNSLTHAGDGSGRLFVTTLSGAVYVIDNGVLLPMPLLDVVNAGVPLRTGGERGLLGLAFHPDFAAPEGTPGSGLLYTSTSELRAGAADFDHPELVPNDLGDHHSVIREWTVSAQDPNVVDTTLGSRVLLRVNQPQWNHNGGDLAFGPDGYLYFSLGDGGGSNDNWGGLDAAEDGHTNGGLGNAQDPTNVYGSILRIDPLGSNAANGQYGVPADNPLLGQLGLDEIYAYGLRNPFRISFDSLTGDLYAGDVGQDQREEIDWILPGENYGWVYLEGSRINRAGGPPGTILPVGEYTHDEGVAVIGGFVYRGLGVAGLWGDYVFGDLRGPSGIGRLFSLDLDSGEIRELQVDPDGEPPPGQLYGLGEDEQGELYYLFGTGDVLRVVPEPPMMLPLLLAAAALSRSRRASALALASGPGRESPGTSRRIR